MVKHRQIEKDGLVVTRFSGRHTYKDASKTLDELCELNKGNIEIYEIVINDNDIILDFSREEEKLLYSKVESTFANFVRGALAVVADNDLVFGLSRMLEISIQNERIAIAVFRSEALARKWIQEIRELHTEELHKDRSYSRDL